MSCRHLGLVLDPNWEWARRPTCLCQVVAAALVTASCSIKKLYCNLCPERICRLQYRPSKQKWTHQSRWIFNIKESYIEENLSCFDIVMYWYHRGRRPYGVGITAWLLLKCDSRLKECSIYVIYLDVLFSSILSSIIRGNWSWCIIKLRCYSFFDITWYWNLKVENSDISPVKFTFDSKELDYEFEVQYHFQYLGPFWYSVIPRYMNIGTRPLIQKFSNLPKNPKVDDWWSALLVAPGPCFPLAKPGR